MLKRFAILAIALVVLFGGIAFVKSQQMKGLSAIKKSSASCCRHEHASNSSILATYAKNSWYLLRQPECHYPKRTTRHS